LDEIPRIRERIDEIDQKLVLLLKDRCENARLLGRIKRARGIASRDPERERIILRKVQESAARLCLEPKLTLPIFKAVFNFSVQAQRVTPPMMPSGLSGRKYSSWEEPAARVVSSRISQVFMGIGQNCRPNSSADPEDSKRDESGSWPGL
jgi:chorismate mutase